VANYLRVWPLNLLTGTPPSLAEVAVLRFRKCSFFPFFFVVGARSCSCSSASMTGEVLSADCGRDIEAEAMVGSTGSEAGIEAGFGACVLRFLGTGASSN